MMKNNTILPILMVMIISIGILVGACQPKPLETGDITRQLEQILSTSVTRNDQIHNAVLTVMKGDGSFAWSGAAGMADQEDQVTMTKDTPFYIASITKMYTAAAIMRLVEQGDIALDDPMAKYLPEKMIEGIHIYQGHDYTNEITIEQLLAHTSGIADYYTEKSRDGKSLFEVFLADPQRRWTVEETLARVRSEMTPNFAPGVKASYSDTNYQLLGKIVEARTGKPLQVVFEEDFFRPLGLTHTWMAGLSEPIAAPAAAAAEVYSNDRNITGMRSNGAYWADGGIVSTKEDCINFLKALNEGRIVKQDTLASMHRWHPLQGLPMQYGYGTMFFQVPAFINHFVKIPPVWGHTGSTGSFLYYAEDLDLYIAGTIDQTEDRITPIVLMIRAMIVIQQNN